MQQPNPAVKEYCIQQQFADRVIEGGIPYLVDKWGSFAIGVSDYLHFYRENYLNSLDGRQILAELLPLLPEVELAEIKTRIEYADAKFIENTVDVSDCVWGMKAEIKHQYTKQRNWWYYRMPKQIRPDW